MCNPEMCPRAEGHFDRVNDAVYEILHQEFGITRSVILEYAEKFQVCRLSSALIFLRLWMGSSAIIIMSLTRMCA